MISLIFQSTKRHLSKRLENLDWKLEEQKEISELIANNVRTIFFHFEVFMSGRIMYQHIFSIIFPFFSAITIRSLLSKLKTAKCNLILLMEPANFKTLACC